ncbi:MAG: transposase, partial [Paenisporosarcina sp.]|nr:transposase [Paenisporosarcina sp.]
MMSRRKRNWHPVGWFHIVMRGNNRSRIFCTPVDMAAFIAVIDECRERYRFTIIAYCVMTNHYNLLIKSPDVPLDKIMARINRRYSDYYSKKYLHVGRIYEKT